MQGACAVFCNRVAPPLYCAENVLRMRSLPSARTGVQSQVSQSSFLQLEISRNNVSSTSRLAGQCKRRIDARGGWTRPRDVRNNCIPEHGALENVWGKRFFLVLSFTRAPRTEFGETLGRCSR